MSRTKFTSDFICCPGPSCSCLVYMFKKTMLLTFKTSFTTSRICFSVYYWKGSGTESLVGVLLGAKPPSLPGGIFFWHFKRYQSMQCIRGVLDKCPSCFGDVPRNHGYGPAMTLVRLRVAFQVVLKIAILGVPQLGSQLHFQGSPTFKRHFRASWPQMPMMLIDMKSWFIILISDRRFFEKNQPFLLNP